MNKIEYNLWGREFDLDITYDCYSDEEVLESQKEAVKSFLRFSKETDDALESVKEYCLTNNRKEIGSNNIDNIFKYVVPQYLFVPRDEMHQTVAIMCNYKFDLEGGMAIVFQNGKLLDIGKQEIIL
ncbi:DUF6985 domain-containing protein [Eubacterium xylanophilum]|uniref:DUF6985 domain-containing protein n=1 Tax=Eubacterium xylanophilum TaxID=39497 RepID=UPI00047AE301|nr:hypothetical protein [Eubacterium xylanophilum]